MEVKKEFIPILFSKRVALLGGMKAGASHSPQFTQEPWGGGVAHSTPAPSLGSWRLCSEAGARGASAGHTQEAPSSPGPLLPPSPG